MKEINLRDLNNISDENLERINEVADMIINEQKKYRVSFLFIEKALAIYINNNSNINKGIIINHVKILKKWEIISIALDFFKSLDPEIYKKMRDIVYGQNPKIRMNIYKRSEINDFSKEDFEFKNFQRYERNPINAVKGNKDIVYLPIKCGWRYDKEISTSLEKDEGTLEDLLVLVHELAHTLDIFLDYLVDENSVIISDIDNDINLFTESTAIGVERFLIKYLLEKGIISNEKYAENLSIERANNTINLCYITYARSALARRKRENGKIKAEDINEIAEEIGLNNIEKNNLINIIIKLGEKNFIVDAGYAFSGMISPTIMELLDRDKIDEVKRYFNSSRMGNFEGALEALGVELNYEGLDKLKQTMLKHRYEFEIYKQQEQR